VSQLAKRLSSACKSDNASVSRLAHDLAMAHAAALKEIIGWIEVREARDDEPTSAVA
jgi:hypothetical protein